MNKKSIWIIIVILIIALGLWYYGNQSGIETALNELEPVGDVNLADDTTKAVERDLEALDLGDLEGEFEAIDLELENL